ncbi:MAG: FAD-binding oxidoreductase [Maribacter sp.]|nr:FAD-binding oxidoreductase [Maribacter sp.]
MYDYLIVGLGLGGISFCETLERNGKTFKVISDASQTSSLVAGGMYNPVILKRFTLAWMAEEQLEKALPFYHELERRHGIKIVHEMPVLRRFASIGEQNAWFEAADRPGLCKFLSNKIIVNQNAAICAPYGYGKVLHTGRIDTLQLYAIYSKVLLESDLLQQVTFDYAQVKHHPEGIEYGPIQAKHLVFAEGFGLKQNPYLNYLPLNGTKGEYLTIKAPELRESNVIKASVFIIPFSDDLYRVGATYGWKDFTNAPTGQARQELLQKLKMFLKCDFEIIDQIAGIRPTVIDRTPLVGRHPSYHNLYVLNGFGSRGVMVAPFAAEQLYRFIENQKPINPEMDCARFTKKYYKT